MKRMGRLVSFSGALLLGAAGFLLAHDPPKKSSDTGGMMKGGQEHHAAAMKSCDEAKMHLAKAKKAGTMAEMRRHVEAAEKSLGEMEKHMSASMEKMHGSMMGGGGMMSGEKKATGRVVDPVCGMDVDSTSAYSATHNGKTYSFCSEEDKAKFQKNPERYVPKKS